MTLRRPLVLSALILALISVFSKANDAQTLTAAVTLPCSGCWNVHTSISSVFDGLRVYIGTTDAPEALLRNILEVSGVHLYAKSNDVINADVRLLPISSARPEEK